jgi:hypothetical protein
MLERLIEIEALYPSKPTHCSGFRKSAQKKKLTNNYILVIGKKNYRRII